MEELYIGEDIPKHEEDLFLGDEQKQKDVISKRNDFSYDDWSVPLPLDEVYKLLVSNRPKSYSNPKQYFQTTTDIFRVAGIYYFSVPTANEKKRLSDWCASWINEAEKKWSRTAGDKISEIESALNNLKNFFENYSDYYHSLEQNIFSKLHGSLAEKCKDLILEISEIDELLLSAKELNLWSSKTPERRDIVLKYIREYCDNHNCKIESFDKTFSRYVLQKEKIEKLDVPDTYNKLCSEYNRLKDLDSKINGTVYNDSESQLLDEVKEVLAKYNIELIDNYSYYKENFFSRITAQYDLSQPIYSKTYDLLEREAKTTYKFSDRQWQNLLVETKLKKDTDISAVFIIGKRAASSLSNIAKLLRENKSLALQRIDDGDLETYFHHIQKRNIEQAIKEARDNYQGDNLLERVCDILETQTEINLANNFELAKEIEKNYAEIKKELETSVVPSIVLKVEKLDNKEYLYEVKSLIESYRANDISEKECLNSILLILEDNYYVVGNEKLEHPKQILDLHKKERDETIQDLIERKSKVSIWINKMYPSLNESIDKWRNDGIYNEKTLKIALRENSSFVYNRKEVASIQTLEKYVLDDLTFFWNEYREKKTFTDSFLVYLNEYLGCSYIRFLINLLNNVQKADIEITNKIVLFLRDNYYEENNFIGYTQVFIPVINQLKDKEYISENVYMEVGAKNDEMFDLYNHFIDVQEENATQQIEKEQTKSRFFHKFKK